jgi:hypothetical protein
VRLRNNQRRSRERRKEYIEDIKKRLLEYESKGVDASMKIEHNAKQMAEENKHLRALLAQQGISEQYIQQYVHAAQNGFDTSASNSDATPMPKLQNRRESLEPANSFNVSPATMPSDLLSTSLAPTPFTPLSASSLDQTAGVADSFQTLAIEARLPYGQIMPSTAMFGDKTASQESYCNQNDMPCQDAAQMIASLRWHKDIELAREELGCLPGQICRISHSRIMELMS